MTFVTWNRKSVSVICRVTWFIIRPTIWNEFDIVCIKLWAFFFFLQILHAISKVQLCCSIFSIKTFSKLVPSFGEVVWPFGNFLFVFCAFGYLTFLPFVCDTFLILWNVKRGIFCDYFSLLFIDISLNVLQCFSSSKFSLSLSSLAKSLRAFESSSGWWFSPAFIAPEVFSIPS